MNIDIAMCVIDEIARKLGVPAEQIIPEISKLNIAHHAFICVTMSVVFLILLVAIIVCVKKQDEFVDIAFALSCLACVIVIAAVYQGYELVGWMVSPQAKTIEHVLQYMR